MAEGKQASIYLRSDAKDAVQRHVRRTGWSFSRCVCDLIVRGDKVVGIREHLGEMGEEWANRSDTC